MVMGQVRTVELRTDSRKGGSSAAIIAPEGWTAGQGRLLSLHGEARLNRYELQRALSSVIVDEEARIPVRDIGPLMKALRFELGIETNRFEIAPGKIRLTGASKFTIGTKDRRIISAEEGLKIFGKILEGKNGAIDAPLSERAVSLVQGIVDALSEAAGKDIAGEVAGRISNERIESARAREEYHAPGMFGRRGC